jgi:hypothetical protein
MAVLTAGAGAYAISQSNIEQNSDPYYYRLESPTQKPEDAAMQVASQQIWGLTPRGGLGPIVQAYPGQLPDGRPGIEFTTPIAPEPGSSIPGVESRWYGGITPGVIINPQGYAVLPVTITKNTQVQR